MSDCVFYDKLLLFSMDIENVFGENWIVEKLYFHFNKNSIEGKFVKPYVIKFIINQHDEENNIVKKEEHKWSLGDIYEKMEIIPLYILKGFPNTDYGVVDINDKVFPISSNTEALSQLLPYEDISYNFEVKHGSIRIDEVVISEVEKMLKDNGIEYSIVTSTPDEVKQNDEDLSPPPSLPPKYISVYGVYEECEPEYKINISLDGRSYNETGYCISPEPVDYKRYKSIGKFKYFSKKTVSVPNDEHLALITKCPDCEASVICDWLSLKGTPCPYCQRLIKL